MSNTPILRIAMLAAGLLAGTVSGWAQAKVATLNFQNALLETTEMKKAQTEMEGKYRPRQTEMEKMQQELQALQQQLQAQPPKLSPQQQQEVAARGQRRQRDLQRMTEDLQQEVERDRNDILARAGQRMRDVIQKLSEEKGYDLVIDVTTTLYAKSATDITKDVTAAYDKTYAGAAAPAAPATPAAAK